MIPCLLTSRVLVEMPIMPVDRHFPVHTASFMSTRQVHVNRQEQHVDRNVLLSTYNDVQSWTQGSRPVNKEILHVDKTLSRI